jgi:hypothetical protein
VTAHQPMSTQGLDHACRVLGLGPGASRAEAWHAHRRLVSDPEEAEAERWALDEALDWILDHHPDAAYPDETWVAGPQPDAQEALRPPVAEDDDEAVMWRSAGWPIAFGTVGAGLAASDFDAGVVAAGVAGELEVAAAIDTSIRRADAFVFHSVTPSGGSGDVDHAIVCGDLLICIDAKRWAPGRYESAQGPNGMAAYRDGALFPAGTASSSAFLAGLLADDLAWPGRVSRIIAVTSSGGRDRPVDLSGYTHPDAIAVGVEQLPEVIDRLLGSTTRQGYTAAAVTALAARAATPTVRSPLRRADPRTESSCVDRAIATRRAPALLDPTATIAKARLASLAYLALIALVALLAWVVGDLSGWPRWVLAAATVSAGLWVLLLVGDVETDNGASHLAIAELVALRRALLLDRARHLIPMGHRDQRGPVVAVVGLSLSGLGVLYLLFLRQGALVDLNRIATLAVVVGGTALATSAWVILERDAARVNAMRGLWPELWADAIGELAAADERAASAALAVLVDHPDGVLGDYLDAWAIGPAATTRIAWAGAMVSEGRLVLER